MQRSNGLQELLAVVVGNALIGNTRLPQRLRDDSRAFLARETLGVVGAVCRFAGVSRFLVDALQSLIKLFSNFVA